jgi:putative oxidoreductase
MNIALWIVQLLLAAMFGMAGFLKTTTPIDQLAAMMQWPGAVPPALVRFIGIAEFTAAIGLLLPALSRIKPWLTPFAASGLLTIIFHITRGELSILPMNGILGALAAFVAWGRFVRAPIAERGAALRGRAVAAK